MLTAFHQNLSIDVDGVDALTDWYLESGSTGLFSACLSSEAHLMDSGETVALVKRVVARTEGRVPVAAGAMGNRTTAERVDLCKRLRDAGAEVVVLVANAFADADEPDELLESRLLDFADQCPGVALGLYECPVPYKRLVGPAPLEGLAKSGRFEWLKETSCDLETLRAKIAVAAGTPLRVFNANLRLMLDTIDIGGAGFSGIFANFFPGVIADLTDVSTRRRPPDAGLFEQVLSVDAELVERHYQSSYPAIAKHCAAQQGVPIEPWSRSPCVLTDASVAAVGRAIDVLGRMPKRPIARPAATQAMA